MAAAAGDSESVAGIGRRRLTEIFAGGAAGRTPRVPTSWSELERLARKVMSPEAWAYVAGGAGLESTLDENRRAFERWRIVPRMLAAVPAVDLSTELFGRRLPAPLFLSPVGVLELAHRRADLAVAEAAASAGVPMIFSNQASVSMEKCAAAMTARAGAAAPRWFQLYWSTSDALVESFLQRAEACGCEALVLTLDTSMLGFRPRDLDLGSLPFLQGRGLAQYLSDPVFRASLNEPPPASSPPPPRPVLGPGTAVTLLHQIARYPGTWREKLSGRPTAAVRRFLATYSRPSLGWSDLAWLRERTSLPLVLKGILHPEDARRALDHGADAVLVSNHGGRQVDGSLGALAALPAVVEAIDGRAPVLFDSGVRGGADIFRALALGATAVGLGRPYVYGLALAGREGVRDVLRNTLADLELTLLLAGCRDLAEVSFDRLAGQPS
ncbi:MAG: alpha-hydroxy-acid oxidizing protein [Acidobacteriota bacterium]